MICLELKFQRDKVLSISRWEMNTWQQILGIFYLDLAAKRIKNSRYVPRAGTEMTLEMIDGFETSNQDSTDMLQLTRSHLIKPKLNVTY